MDVMTDKEWYEERKGDKMVKRKKCLCNLLKNRGGDTKGLGIAPSREVGE